MSRWIASSDYQVIEREPLLFVAGERVRVDQGDRAWPGWFWVVNGDGRGGHVPSEVLAGPVVAGAEAELIRDFDGRDLSVRRGDELVSLRELDGWHWCRNQEGDEGWVAAYLLKRAE